MTDGNGVRWFKVRELATAWERSPKTVRRLARAYREQCRLSRDPCHPRRLLRIPEPVVALIVSRLKRGAIAGSVKQNRYT